MWRDGDDEPIYHRLSEAPKYHAWSGRKLEDGEDEEVLIRLGQITLWISRSELTKLSGKDFERMLVDLRHECRNE